MGNNIVPSYGMLTLIANYHVELGIGRKKLAGVGAAKWGTGHLENGYIYTYTTR
jgi:hypothetical protein